MRSSMKMATCRASCGVRLMNALFMACGPTVHRHRPMCRLDGISGGKAVCVRECPAFRRRIVPDWNDPPPSSALSECQLCRVKDGGLLLDRFLQELDTPRACHPERNRGPRQALGGLLGSNPGSGDGHFCHCWGGIAKDLLFSLTHAWFSPSGGRLRCLLLWKRSCVWLKSWR